MTIIYSRLPAIVNALQHAIKDDKMWMGLDRKVQIPSVSDLHYFDSHHDALNFQEFNQSRQKDVDLFPLIVTLDAIHASVDASLQNGVQQPNVQLEANAMQALHEDYMFQTTVSNFTEMMDSFNWNNAFYDPLEANTEAESFEDKIEFNRLESLVEELSSFAQSSERGQEAVTELLDRYWKGQPMDLQIVDVLQGKYHKPDLLINHPKVVNNERDLTYRIDPDANPLYNMDGNDFTDALIEHIEQQQLFNNKLNLMNQNNFAYLKDNIKYTGFGEALYPELEKNIIAKKDEFQLHFTTQISNRPFDAVLDFRKSNTSDMYFFNRYTATVERNNGEKLSQSFAITKGKGVTAKEAYNLLQGRAVKREMTNAKGEEYIAWIQLDFDIKDEKGNFKVNKYNENYGYDLRESIASFPVLELDGGEKEKDLLRSLEKGNVQAVAIEINGNPERMFIEANPQYKTINIYDNSFKLMKHRDIPLKQEQTQKPELSQENKHATTQKQKQPEKKANTQKNGNGLISKKRTRNQKGVKI